MLAAGGILGSHCKAPPCRVGQSNTGDAGGGVVSVADGSGVPDCGAFRVHGANLFYTTSHVIEVVTRVFLYELLCD